MLANQGTKHTESGLGHRQCGCWPWRYSTEDLRRHSTPGRVKEIEEYVLSVLINTSLRHVSGGSSRHRELCDGELCGRILLQKHDLWFPRRSIKGTY